MILDTKTIVSEDSLVGKRIGVVSNDDILDYRTKKM